MGDRLDRPFLYMNTSQCGYNKLRKNRIPLILFLFLLFSYCPSKPDKPNLLLLTLDTLRADALGCYGNEIVQTPNLDRLAAGGALFENAVCNIPATLTSHTSMMTGRLPRTSGVRFRTARVSDKEETLAEMLLQHGYETGAMISGKVLAPHFKLDQGFQTYSLGSINQDVNNQYPERRAEETISEAIGFLKEKRNGPFFLWIHLYDPHTPYDAPAPYHSIYDPDYEGALRGTVRDITRLTASKGSALSSRDREHLQALYHGEVTYMDHHIGRLLDFMEEQKILDNTLIAAIADHGENLGEGGRFFHGDDLYEPALRIPFLLRFPKKIQAGIRIAEQAQAIDLLPTLLALLGINSDVSMDGRSLVPWLLETSDSTPGHPAFLETEADPVCDTNKLYGLRMREHKFIYHTKRRRAETPLGVFTEIPLKGPTIVLLRIQGDPSIRLMAHVRYRTKELYTSRNFQALTRLNTTAVYAESFGSHPLHKEAATQPSFLTTPNGWRLQVSPDIYEIALEYGEARGWPTQWMVLEGVGVDASLPYNQSIGSFQIDQIELYAPSLRFPQSPRYRKPFWVIEDFEAVQSKGLMDAGEGPPHTIQIRWETNNLFGGKRMQSITIEYLDEESRDTEDELFDLRSKEGEIQNLLIPDPTNPEKHQEALTVSEDYRLQLDQWLQSEPGTSEYFELDAVQRKALKSLGYIQ